MLGVAGLINVIFHIRKLEMCAYIKACENSHSLVYVAKNEMQLKGMLAAYVVLHDGTFCVNPLVYTTLEAVLCHVFFLQRDCPDFINLLFEKLVQKDTLMRAHARSNWLLAITQKRQKKITWSVQRAFSVIENDIKDAMEEMHMVSDEDIDAVAAGMYEMQQKIEAEIEQNFNEYENVMAAPIENASEDKLLERAAKIADV